MVWSGCLKIGLWLQLHLMRVQKPDWTKLLNTKSTSLNEGRGRKKAWGDQVWAWVIVVGGKRAVTVVDIPAITPITTVRVLNSQVTHSKIYVWHRFPGVSLLSPCVMTLTCVCVLSCTSLLSCTSYLHLNWTLLNSDGQGFGNPPGVMGGGQKGNSQSENFWTLNKPLPSWRVKGFSLQFFPLLSECSGSSMFIKVSFIDAEPEKF